MGYNQRVSPGPAVSALSDPPYISVRMAADQLVVKGQRSCCLGHRTAEGADAAAGGVFATWSLEGNALTVRNDRYGVFPLFFCTSDRELCISPSIPQLLRLGASPELDDAAVAVFLRFGFCPGEDTVFRAIRAVPPGARMTWLDGTLRVTTARPIWKAAQTTRTAAIDDYIELFRQAINRRLPDHDDFCLPLTGGRDSRHILFELHRARRPPRFSVTSNVYPPARNEDARVGAEVAFAVGQRHVVVTPSPARFADNYDAAQTTSFNAVGFGLYRALSDYVAANARVSYDGIGGDILSAGLLLTPRRIQLVHDQRVGALFDDLCEERDSALRLLLNPGAFARFNRDLAQERFEREFAHYASEGNPLTAFLFFNRTRRFIASLPYSMMNRTVVHAPYLDRDLFDFLMSLPIDLTQSGTLHDETIRTAFPEHAGLPFASKDVPADAPAVRHHHKCVRDLMSHVATHPPQSLINVSKLTPRWLASLTCPWLTKGHDWHFDPVVYLLSLEAAIRATRS